MGVTPFIRKCEKINSQHGAAEDIESSLETESLLLNTAYESVHEEPL
jgi:hypothetical protein